MVSSRFIFFFILTSFFIQAQESIKDSLTIQNILNKRNQDVPTLIQITNNKEKELIRSYIRIKSEEKTQKQKIKDSIFNNQIGIRYKHGDSSVKPKIINILRRKDLEEIYDLFQQLEVDYNKREEGIVLENDLKQEIFSLITNKKFEHIVVQFVGFNRVSGGKELFEERLLSGESSDNDRIFYWLAEFESQKAIDYIYNQYINNKINLEEYSWIESGFSEYLNNNDLNSKNKILDIVYDYLKKKPLTKKRYTESSFLTFPNGNDLSMNFTLLALQHNDIRNKEIVEHLKKELEGTEIISNLKYIESYSIIISSNDLNKKKKELVSLINDKESYFDTLDFIKKDSILYKEQDLNTLILQNLEKHNFLGSYDFYKLINYFEQYSKEEFYTLLEDNPIHSDAKKELKKRFEISKLTFNEINDYLLTHKIIDTPITSEQIKKHKEQEFYYYENINTIETCLDIANISISFDTETSTIPVDYDNLLEGFISKSKNKIKNITYYLQSYYDENSEDMIYHFFVSTKENCYVLIPEDFGDWYDMETFMKLIQSIVDEFKVKEKFVRVETNDQTAFYIFGEEEKINELKNTFNLDN